MQKIRKSRIKGLIEFSRAVHAEMAAIVSAARDGLGQVRGATLFTTTFPCHNCARHIVADGIRKVIYIEPYPKSLALTLHNDAISTNENDEEKKVVFLQYQVAAPRSFSRIFKLNPEPLAKLSGVRIIYIM
jgi:deoxycytidylate deaminase